MPHIVLEASPELEPVIKDIHLLEKLHDELANTETVELARIKSRAFYSNEVVVGENKQGSFIHVTVSILTGRSEDVRRSLGQKVFEKLKKETEAQAFNSPHVTLEVREMNKETYFR